MAFNLPDLFSTAQFYQLPTSDMQTPHEMSPDCLDSGKSLANSPLPKCSLLCIGLMR
ncbi:unnamed protein product [Eretmochelys imbricata]